MLFLLIFEPAPHQKMAQFNVYFVKQNWLFTHGSCTIYSAFNMTWRQEDNLGALNDKKWLRPGVWKCCGSCMIYVFITLLYTVTASRGSAVPISAIRKSTKTYWKNPQNIKDPVKKRKYIKIHNSRVQFNTTLLFLF